MAFENRCRIPALHSWEQVYEAAAVGGPEMLEYLANGDLSEFIGVTTPSTFVVVGPGPFILFPAMRRRRAWLSATTFPPVCEWLGDSIPVLSPYIDEAFIHEERSF